MENDLTLDTIRERKHGTDAEILEGFRQPGDDWIDQHDTYTWYRAIAAIKRPKLILELGVRYGYAGVAMIRGAMDSGYAASYTGVDAEMDGISSNDIACASLHKALWKPSASLSMFKQDTRHFKAGDTLIGNCDIVHIDGDHSPDGVIAELLIAETCVAPDGLILIDDVDCSHVKAAAIQFAQEYGIVPVLIPTFHGMYLIDMRNRLTI